MADYIDPVEVDNYGPEVEQYLVKPASAYLKDLLEEFSPSYPTSPVEMFSTKLRGGIDFRPYELTCWAGYNGHRKSMFTNQVALDLIAQKQRVLIASFEMEPARTLARMARQAYGVAKPNPQRLTDFAKWTDGRLWLLNHVGRIAPDRMLAVLRYFASVKKGHHVFIDSMMMVCSSEESLDEQKQFVTDLVRSAVELGLHIHLVAHCRKPQNGEERAPTKYDLRGSAAISDQAHNVFTVWANKAKKAKLERDSLNAEALAEPDALVSLEKQRNGRWEGKVKLWFDEESLRFVDDRLSVVGPYAALTQ